MLPLTEKVIRTSFTNTSLRERTGAVLPPNLDELAWDKLDYLGWRDPKTPDLGYIVTDLDGVPTGVMVRQSATKPRARAQCSWCEDITLPNEVVYFAAKRTGDAGRKGNTVAILVCSNFECSRNVRKLPPVAYLGFDAEAARLQRIAALGEHVRAFVAAV